MDAGMGMALGLTLVTILTMFGAQFTTDMRLDLGRLVVRLHVVGAGLVIGIGFADLIPSMIFVFVLCGLVVCCVDALQKSLTGVHITFMAVLMSAGFVAGYAFAPMLGPDWTLPVSWATLFMCTVFMFIHGLRSDQANTTSQS